jgi:CheY-like chemotaxis protein
LAVNDLIAKAIENFRPNYEDKEIDIQVVMDDDLPTVHWDFQKMLQVFQNLLDNALKFTSEGGKIVISAHSKSDFVELNIEDNGIGIPQSELDRIFERFYQVDSSSTRRFGGSGLGLSIVREIILAHRGKIFVESEEGKGTSFQILVPIGEPDRSEKDEQDAQVPQTDLPREGPLGNGEMILVVDDDMAFLQMMDMILPKEGYQVHSTTDSTRVIELARTHDADLIILDLMMPEIDGFQVCRHIRKDADLSDIPILVVSAAGSHEVGRKVFEVGADKHITKPFDQQDLFFQLDKLLKESTKRTKEGSLGSEKKKGSQETRG